MFYYPQRLLVIFFLFATLVRSCKECPFSGSWTLKNVSNEECLENEFVIFSKTLNFYQLDKLYIIVVEDWVSCFSNITISIISKGYIFIQKETKSRSLNIDFNLTHCHIQVYRKNISMNYDPSWKNEACDLNLEFKISKDCRKMFVSKNNFVEEFARSL